MSVKNLKNLVLQYYRNVISHLAVIFARLYCYATMFQFFLIQVF